jgi:EAL domain-containing protein (putative c-di-GMP-specific phosphodiesterase class I)/GGDEF domain-containing protein
MTSKSLSAQDIAIACRIVAARRGQARMRLVFAAILATAFAPLSGLIPAALWLSAYVFVQAFESRALRGAWDVPAEVTPGRAVSALVYVSFSNFVLASYGLLEAANGGMWGLLCACLLWSTMLMYSTVISAGSRIAGVAMLSPHLLCFLTAPMFAFAQGDSFVLGILVVLGALVNVVSTLTIWKQFRGLFESKERATILEQALLWHTETGLPTRTALEQFAKQALAEESDGYVYASIEIERHEALRGVIGFDMYARLLTGAANRLREVAPTDMLAQISSGGFGMIFKSAEARRAETRAEKLRDCFDTPLMLEGLAIDITVRVGLAPCIDPSLSLRQATIAISQARTAGRTIAFFDAEAYGDPVANLALMSEMKQAIAKGDVSLYYQPKLELSSGKVLAAEALCRWSHPTRGAISPTSFVALAEETGQIRLFTEWTIAQAVADQARMHAVGCDIKIAVNVSGALLDDAAFAARALLLVEGAVGEMCFEITETASIANPAMAQQHARQWAEAGVSIAIDDYGTGYSTLSYIKALSATELKLDRAFITDLTTSRTDAVMAQSTIDLAHKLGIEVTAEGVENAETHNLLVTLGCDWAQGFWLSKPLPLDAFIDFLIAYARPALPSNVRVFEPRPMRRPAL